MAGDWIKIENSLYDKPEVIRIAELTRSSRFTVMGKLIRLWCWFDAHSESGDALISEAALNEMLECDDSVTLRASLKRTHVCADVTKRFLEALKEVGWLTCKEGICTIPKFERHCSKSAKGRALQRERMKRLRCKSCDDSVTPRASLEKRREEYKRGIVLPNTDSSPPTPSNQPPQQLKKSKKELSILDLKDILKTKEDRLNELKWQHYSQAAMSGHWDKPEHRDQAKKLTAEIKSIKSKIEEKAL